MAPVLAFVLFAVATFAPSTQAQKREPVVGLPCDGCEAVFEGMPTTIASASRIGAAGEPGEPMRIEGVVRDKAGRPAAGVVVYAYQTNAKGIYPAANTASAMANRHGLLRGWAKTDANGRYRFDTIRPGGYPSTTIPQHVHMHIIEPGRATYYIDEMVFTDDPRLTPEQRKAHTIGRGGTAVVTPKRDAGGTWVVARDIALGEAIPGYPSGKL